MSSEEVVYRRWTCEGCGTTELTEGKGRTLPAGWTDSTSVEFEMGPSAGYHALDLCPKCSKNPAAAIRRWRKSIGQ